MQCQYCRTSGGNMRKCKKCGQKYCEPWVDTVKWVRFHVAPDKVAPFKNGEGRQKLSQAIQSPGLTNG